jgi:hypothetical protein
VRGAFLVLSLAALSGCRASAPPRDCRLAAEQAPQCFRAHQGQADRDLLLGCFPFSGPETIAGAWVYGFENNAFYEHARASARMARVKRSDTALEAGINLPNDGRTRVLQVTLVGRRSRCDLGYPPKAIVVDRIIAGEVVAVLD